MFSNIFDSHTHTDNSPDGNHSAMMLCEYAVARGLSGIAITDHCEIQSFFKDNYDVRIKQSNFEANKARAVFGKQLVVSAGIELGQPLEDLAQTDDLLSTYDFDFILCSVHNLVKQLDFAFNDYSNYGEEQIDIVFSSYLGLVYKTVKWNGLDSLAHLTYPLRYMMGLHKKPVNLDHHYQQIDEILKLLAQNGKALEINSSGLRQRIGVTLPPFPILKRFKEHGGELVTIGSDSHFAEDVGKGIEDVMEYMLSIGYKYFTFFKKREPHLLRIL